MYQIEGAEFSGLIKRAFTEGLMADQSSELRHNLFSCHAGSLRESSFDILHFRADFQQCVQVNKLIDTSHVSLHFQLSGWSDARISGFDRTLPMAKGNFNLLNCTDPVSSFTFPAQKGYAYLCIGLRPSFFGQLLSECGPAYEKLARQSELRQSFSLFAENRMTSQLQRDALRLIQSPPVADTLRLPYIRSKVKELVLLCLEQYPAQNHHNRQNPKTWIISPRDTERLHEARVYLNQNYLLPLTLEQISREFLLNEFKLKSGFKALFSITVFDYIHQLRMEHAKALIQSRGYSVSEIAALVGYSSDTSFIRAFGKYYGHSPGKK